MNNPHTKRNLHHYRFGESWFETPNTEPLRETIFTGLCFIFLVAVVMLIYILVLNGSK